MLSLSTLGSTQVHRAAAFPAKFTDNPLRAVVLDAVQRRNALFDALFYDIGAVTADETPDLAFWLAREGAIVLAPPSGGGRIQVFPTIEGFLREHADVAGLAVAGVGSSALGAAAFARNVADALGQPVAAVVSGYGLADVLTEALGGFFWFGALNSIRHAFEPLDAATKRFTHSEPPPAFAGSAVLPRTSKDTQTVLALLRDPGFRTPLLVGHSKGNLVISEALYALSGEDAALARTLGQRLRIVTVSARIGMPPPFRHVLDVMGEWDWFGALNSRPDIPADYTVPGAWHSTNPEFPLGLGIRVGAMLQAVLPLFDTPRRAPATGPRPRLPMADLPQRLTAALHAGSTSARPPAAAGRAVRRAASP